MLRGSPLLDVNNNIDACAFCLACQTSDSDARVRHTLLELVHAFMPRVAAHEGKVRLVGDLPLAQLCGVKGMHVLHACTSGTINRSRSLQRGVGARQPDTRRVQAEHLKRHAWIC